jgi:hypothetical protein
MEEYEVTILVKFGDDVPLSKSRKSMAVVSS